MMPKPQHLRVFLASPGDVADERGLARHLLKDELPYDPFLRGRVTFDIISWDDPAAPTVLPACIPPQEALIRFTGRPSDCDIVIIVLWSRLGTHLDLTKFQKDNGDPYLSGTEWEYEDARKGRLDILIYRRTEVPKVDLDALDLDEKKRQYQLVRQFCERVPKNLDGSFRGNVTDYVTPTAFKERLATDLKQLLRERLGQSDTGSMAAIMPPWSGSPYPGLRAFTLEEGAIFYGRGHEVDALIISLRDSTQRFLAVTGTSGTGKSSLIHAGLIPRLQDGAIEGSQKWRFITCTPGSLGDNPFLALAAGLSGIQPSQAQKSPVEIAMILAKAPQRIADYAVAPNGGAVLLFIDQLEELFTHVADLYRKPFSSLLAHAAAQPFLRVVATLRADFLPQCATLPDLASLFRRGTFVLAPPGPTALADMIRKPAERAGLVLEEGLTDEILKDAGANPGVLPLMAFCLEELYQQTSPNHRLTMDAYNALGRLRGAISRRAEALLEELREIQGADLDAALPQVFQVLVHVDAAGTATRLRASQDELGETTLVSIIIDKLVKGRLLVAEDANCRPTVTLAHEALLLEWPALRKWLGENQAQMQRIQRGLASLASSEPTDRLWAVDTLAEIGLVTLKILPALIMALGDTKESVRKRAVEALGRIGSATEAVQALTAALSHKNEHVREGAAKVLGRIGPAAANALPVMIQTLRDSNENVRRSIAEALGRVGSASAEVVPALIEAIRDKDASVRKFVAEALGRIGPAAVEAIPSLQCVADDKQEQRVIRGMAAVALMRIKKNNPLDGDEDAICT